MPLTPTPTLIKVAWPLVRRAMWHMDLGYLGVCRALHKAATSFLFVWSNLHPECRYMFNSMVHALKRSKDITLHVM